MHRAGELVLLVRLKSLQMAPPESEGGVDGGVGGMHSGGAGGAVLRARKRFSITANSATFSNDFY